MRQSVGAFRDWPGTKTSTRRLTARVGTPPRRGAGRVDAGRSRLRLGHLCQWIQESKGADGPIRGEERFLGILRALYGENVNRDWVSGIIIICVPSVDVRVDVDGDDFK